MHTLPGTLSRHLSVTLYFLLCYKFYFSLRMYLKSRAATSWFLNKKGIHAVGAVMEKTANIYMQCSLLQTWRKLVCVCVFLHGWGQRRGEANVAAAKAEPIHLSSAWLLWPLKGEYGSGHLKGPAVRFIWGVMIRPELQPGEKGALKKAEMQRKRASHWGTEWSELSLLKPHG